MKTRAIILASVLLVGCQATDKQPPQTNAGNQNLSSASKFFAKHSQSGNLDWLIAEDGQSEKICGKSSALS